MPHQPGSGRQQEVYQFIKLNPGTHLREIQRRLSISSMGNLEYHIIILKKLKLVVENTEGGYKRYYPAHGAVLNKRLLALLRQKNPRRIALLLLENMRKNGCLSIEHEGENKDEEAAGGGDAGGDGDEEGDKEGDRDEKGDGGGDRDEEGDEEGDRDEEGDGGEQESPGPDHDTRIHDLTSGAPPTPLPTPL